MLKISITETAAETRWVLQGRVFGPWVSELSTIWRTSTRTRKGRACIVDLDAVTFIDKGAEKLLRTMAREGAQFIANGLYIQNVFGKPKVIGRRGRSETLAAILAFFTQIASNNEHYAGALRDVKSSYRKDHA
ncbi:MAG: hypothetical protein WAN72_12635 [Candidatus Acidiferrales bacterium]